MNAGHCSDDAQSRNARVGRTGFNVREGSRILADRRAERERCQAVADAMIRRAKIQRLWREAYEALYGPLRLAA